MGESCGARDHSFPFPRRALCSFLALYELLIRLSLAKKKKKGYLCESFLLREEVDYEKEQTSENGGGGGKSTAGDEGVGNDKKKGSVIGPLLPSLTRTKRMTIEISMKIRFHLSMS